MVLLSQHGSQRPTMVALLTRPLLIAAWVWLGYKCTRYPSAVKRAWCSSMTVLSNAWTCTYVWFYNHPATTFKQRYGHKMFFVLIEMYTLGKLTAILSKGVNFCSCLFQVHQAPWGKQIILKVNISLSSYLFFLFFFFHSFERLANKCADENSIHNQKKHLPS